MNQKAKLKELKTLHGNLKLPAFFPDATQGYIRGPSSRDLINLNVDGVVVNTYHLLLHNLINKIKRKGGIHNYMNLNKPIISDSGGFQIMSIIHNRKLGKIQGDKIIFTLDNKKITMTPESCIDLQFKIGSDIIMCLDDCTRPDMTEKEQKLSVKRTIKWAKKCKIEFKKQVKKRKTRPLLFSIIQGGENKKLRKLCAKKLLEIGFDGYAFGGFPMKNGKFLKNILKYTSSLIPNNLPKYAMGIGKPQDIIDCVKLGYNMFDCVIPTRDARHKRFYIFNNKTKTNHNTLYLRGRHKNNNSPISNICDCHTCKNHALSKLHSLHKSRDKEYVRLSSIHNLRFYSRLMEKLRKL